MRRSHRVTLGTNTQKAVSGAAVVFGSCIGLGFIILPVLSVTAWTSGVIIILLVTLAVSYTASIKYLEISSYHRVSDGMRQILEKAVGAYGRKWVDAIIILSLFVLLYAYFSVISELTMSLLPFHLPHGVVTIIIGVICFVMMVLGIRCMSAVVLICNVLLLIIFVSLIVTLFPQLHVQNLVAEDAMGMLDDPRVALPLLPIFFANCFGFQPMMPALRVLHDQGRKRKGVIASLRLGVIFIIVGYAIWLGIFLSLFDQQSVLSQLALDVSSFDVLYQVFTMSGLTHAFLIVWLVALLAPPIYGVSKGLFDYLLPDQLTVSKRDFLQAGGIAFIPPMVFSYVFPHGFLIAIGFVAVIFGAIWCVLVPWLHWKRRRVAWLSSVLIALYWLLMTVSFFIYSIF
ncbi:aromatic amino acid transport family protein [Vibrio coralliilyticus]|uniref:aromatic amino acid transport family protein n=1 Tax=Vibrio coralliilyticus TaxID=190893 RepID=UPI001E65AB32|nr:aromatic amino acid transport family protein [Vibrio coralliilyticus]MCC2524415.1 tyrosine-specific transport protein [Vibrio coralliilyticus]